MSRAEATRQALTTARDEHEQWRAELNGALDAMQRTLARPTRLQPMAVAMATNQEPKNMLTTEQQTRARELIVQMAAPLCADEKKICALTGITEEAYIEERNRLLAEKLPGGAHGLSESELKTCRLLGMTPEQWRAT